ncbi:copia protein, partial [Tanacetum coccineum]
FKIQKVWILVDLPYGKKAIGTKWVYRNKKDERGVVVRNKARLVAQGHRQEDGIDYDEDKGATSKRPSELQPTPSPPHPSKANIEPQSDPSPRPSPTPHIPDSILVVSGGNQGGQSSNQAKEIKNLKAQIKKLKKQAKPGRKSAKGEPSVNKDHLFDEIPEDTLDYMETEDAQDVGRSRDVMNEEKENADAEVSTEDVLNTAQQKVSTDNEKVSTDIPKVSTDGFKVNTDKEKDSTDRTYEVSREKEKGVEFKDVEETERPRPTSTRSLLILKPLPKIDPKDKGKKKIEEEDESETES